MTLVLAAICLLTPLAEAAPPVPFTLDRPFDLALDQTAVGPDGLTVFFLDEPPNLDVRLDGAPQVLTWASAPTTGTPRMRAHFGAYFLTVEAMSDATHARMQVTLATPAPLRWGEPMALDWCAFAVDPDGGLWSIEGVDRTWVALNYRPLPTLGSGRVTVNLQDGRAHQRAGALLVTVERRSGDTRGARLSLRKPAATVWPLVLGTPFSLMPEESASGNGVTLRLDGYGHKIDLDGRDIPYIEVRLEAAGEQSTLRFFPGSPEALAWRGFVVRLTATEDHGPPHSMTATSTFVVERGGGP